MSALVALFPLELVLLPDTTLPLHIFEPRYKEMIGVCLQRKEPFGILRVARGMSGNQLAQFGCMAEITSVLRTYPDGRMDILTEGRQRFELIDTNEDQAFLRGNVLPLEDVEAADPSSRAQLRSQVKDMHIQLTLLLDADPEIDLDSAILSFQLVSVLPVDLDFKQTILEMRSEEDRLRVLLAYYTQTVPKLKKMVAGRVRAGGNGYVH